MLDRNVRNALINFRISQSDNCGVAYPLGKRTQENLTQVACLFFFFFLKFTTCQGGYWLQMICFTFLW